MLEAKLVVVGGDAKSSEVRLNLPTVIGRGKEAGLTVPHALVSRRHTEVFEREGKLFVRDLGSLNGTFVNNLKIEDEQVLGPNQLLTLGNVTFRALYEVAADALEPTTVSETVSFNEVKTDEVQISQGASKIEIKSTAAEIPIDIDETVPVDELRAAQSAPVGPTATDDNPDSNIFLFDEEAKKEGNSVAIGALGDLPAAAASAVSFVGNVDFGEDSKPMPGQVEPVDIDLGVEKKPVEDNDDPGLGSFLNNLPR